MAFEWTQSKADEAQLRAICPFIHSILDLGGGRASRRGSGPGRPKPFPVMIRLKEILPAEFQEGSAFFKEKGARQRWQRRVKVPALYTKGDMRGRTRIVCTAWVTRWFFVALMWQVAQVGAAL